MDQPIIQSESRRDGAICAGCPRSSLWNLRYNEPHPTLNLVSGPFRGIASHRQQTRELANPQSPRSSGQLAKKPKAKRFAACGSAPT